MKRSRALIGITAAAATAATAVLAGGTTATAGTVSDPIAQGLVGPLQFTFDSAGRPLVAQGFLEEPGVVSRVTKAGDLVDVVQDDGAISGVAVRGGRTAYTLSGGFADDVPLRASLRGAAEGPYQLLKVQNRRGQQRIVADLGKAEANRNPDSHQVYGWLGYNERCGTDAPEGNEPRDGVVESNPHAVAPAPGGGWYVADAAANVIWKAKGGKLRVVSVLKPQPVTIESWMVGEAEQCAVGSRYNFEPVPTDIEVGRGGMLYVSLLPGEGAPGAPFVPGTGAVARVNPATGKSKVISRGFTGATNLALAGDKIYVAELFAGQVTQLNTRNGNLKPVAYLPLPAGLESRGDKLFVSYDIFPPDETSPPNGKLAVLDPSGPAPAPPDVR